MPFLSFLILSRVLGFYFKNETLEYQEFYYILKKRACFGLGLFGLS